MSRRFSNAFLLLSFICVSLGTEAASSPQNCDEQRPQEHFCPITCMVMKDPVVASDGNSYEREAILKWFETKKTSPMTGLPIPAHLCPNQNLKKLIEDWSPPQQSQPIAERTTQEAIKAEKQESKQRAQDESDRLEREQRARDEFERLEREQRARAETARREKEQHARDEFERLEREQRARAETERREEEQRARAVPQIRYRYMSDQEYFATSGRGYPESRSATDRFIDAIFGKN